MIKTKHQIRPPYSQEDIKSMEEMIEQLISIVTIYTGERHSLPVQDFANDVTDVLIDIKVDLTNLHERVSDDKREAIH